jgi:hypothetical protein
VVCSQNRHKTLGLAKGVVSHEHTSLLRCGISLQGESFLPGNAKGGRITVLLTSCLTGLDQFVLQIKTKIVSCHTAGSKPVKQEANGTVILPSLVFPGFYVGIRSHRCQNHRRHKFKNLFIISDCSTSSLGTSAIKLFTDVNYSAP